LIQRVYVAVNIAAQDEEEEEGREEKTEGV